MEPNTGSTSGKACDSGPPDSYPVVGPSPRTPEPTKPSWAPVMEFTAADIFQHLPFGDILNSLKVLSLTENSGSNYARPKWEAGDEEIRCPPTTHFIATVDDLTDVLDFDSEDIDGMDDDAGEDSESMRCRIHASPHDIYMVDTPKEGDGDNEDNTPR